MSYHSIKGHCTYRELGAEYFDRLHKFHVVKRLVFQIQALGYQMSIENIAMAA